MSIDTLLKTKLYIPPVRPELVPRPRLIEQLNAGLHRRLTLVCAPAGFGKTTLMSEWVNESKRPVAWLSLDDNDNDLRRFIVYLIAALQTISREVGESVLGALHSPQPPPSETILTVLINDIAGSSDDFTLVLDDYNLIESRSVLDAVAFLIDHL
ncbi:MAG: LuxR C-terminal-related transcriptional regulator, partial [Planctomycetota bacterium]